MSGPAQCACSVPLPLLHIVHASWLVLYRPYRDSHASSHIPGALAFEQLLKGSSSQ